MQENWGALVRPFETLHLPFFEKFGLKKQIVVG